MFDVLTFLNLHSHPFLTLQVVSFTTKWIEFLYHWPLWAIYVAQFSMNWSNYIIMQWLPTYMSRTLGANKESISLTAMPYVVNSFVGVGEYGDDVLHFSIDFVDLNIISVLQELDTLLII